MTKDEALKQALEALEVATTPLAKDRQEVLRAQAAIREALAEAQQQEPVAWTSWRELAGARHYGTSGWVMHAHKRSDEDIPLYTSPPASKPWVGLTADDVWNDDVVMALNAEMGLPMNKIMALIVWANAKLREKNAQPSKPLTDERIQEDSSWKWGWYLDSFKAGVRYAEAAHGIKGDA